jgi:hypothetical protein
MAIQCPHPRPQLNLPRTTPPQLGWQVPSFLSNDPLELRRQLLAALEGIYLEQTRRFATPTVIPLHDVTYDIPPGSVLRGVADGQTVNLLPPAPGGGSAAPTTFIVDDVITPITVTFTAADGQPASTSIGVPGVHDFVPGTEGTGFQQPPGSSGPLGSGVTSDRVLGRDSAGTGPIEELTVGGGIAFTGAGGLVLDQALDSLARTGVRRNSTGSTFERRVLNLIEDGAVSIGIADDAGDEEVDVTIGVDLSGVTYTAGDGLDLVGQEFSVVAADIAGTNLEDAGDNNLRIAVSAAGAGLQGGGASPLSVVTGNGVTIDGDTVGLAPISDNQVMVNILGSAQPPEGRNLSAFGGSNLSYNATTHAFDVNLSSVTYTAGDGIDLSGNQFSADVSDFAGTGLEDDGANNLRIAASAAGNGLTGGGGSALAVGAGDGIDVTANNVDVDVSDFAGTGLEDDGSNNLRIAASAAGNGLTGGSGSALAVNDGAGLEIVSDAVRISTAAAGGGLGGGGGAALFVQSTLDSNARIGVREGAGTTFLRRRISFIEGSNVSLSVSDDGGNEEVDVIISATDSDTTYTAGDGLDLSGGNQFSIDVSDFAGDGLQDDGVNNLQVNASAIAGTGLNVTSNNLNVNSTLDSNARVGARANSGGSTSLRRRINFIAGTGIDISVVDDAGNEEIDVTITSTGL